MSDTRGKLALYERRAHRTEGSTEAASPTFPDGGARPTLLLGEVELHSLAPGVFRRLLHFPNAAFGEHTLSRYRPFSLTGILELALLPRATAVLPTEILFLDTETTGLSRGAGNYPFLTGLGYFEEDTLVIEQLFLLEPLGEPVYLARLDELVRRFPYMVSYNGRSFDLPLLRSRWILNRIRAGSPVLHFDLLHILRRMFPRGTIPGHSQKDLERELLRFERKDDLPGAAIPQIYFDFTKYGDSTQMDAVFRHNLLDLQGLVFLFLEAIRVYEELDLAGPAVRSGIARILARNRRREEALAVIDGLLREEGPGSPGRRRSDLLFLAELHRARQDWSRAREAYELAAAEFDCVYARLALAKLLEHRRRDWHGALEQVAVLEGRFRASRDGELPRLRALSQSELTHRRTRLESKLRALLDNDVESR